MALYDGNRDFKVSRDGGVGGEERRDTRWHEATGPTGTQGSVETGAQAGQSLGPTGQSLGPIGQRPTVREQGQESPESSFHETTDTGEFPTHQQPTFQVSRPPVSRPPVSRSPVSRSPAPSHKSPSDFCGSGPDPSMIPYSRRGGGNERAQPTVKPRRGTGSIISRPSVICVYPDVVDLAIIGFLRQYGPADFNTLWQSLLFIRDSDKKYAMHRLQRLVTLEAICCLRHVGRRGAVWEVYQLLGGREGSWCLPSM